MAISNMISNLRLVIQQIQFHHSLELNIHLVSEKRLGYGFNQSLSLNELHVQFAMLNTKS